MKKYTLGVVFLAALLLFACIKNIVLPPSDVPASNTHRGVATAEALKVPGFKYILNKFDYGLEGEYEGGIYQTFEELPNIRETAGYYVLELKKDKRPINFYGYLIELADASGKVFDFRYYSGRPEFMAVKKDARLFKLILYSIKLNGNYFDKGLYLSQSYWDHVILKKALVQAKFNLRVYSEKELHNSYEESDVPLVNTGELLAEKQKFIWKLVALTRGGGDLPFISVDVHDSSVYLDEENPAPSIRRRYDYYSPGWSKNWNKKAVVYGILCEVPKEGFNNIFVDRSYIDRPKQMMAKKNPKDVEMTHFFQVVF